jgi:hypothetical protein
MKPGQRFELREALIRDLRASQLHEPPAACRDFPMQVIQRSPAWQHPVMRRPPLMAGSTVYYLDDVKLNCLP